MAMCSACSNKLKLKKLFFFYGLDYGLWIPEIKKIIQIFILLFDKKIIHEMMMCGNERKIRKNNKAEKKLSCEMCYVTSLLIFFYFRLNYVWEIKKLQITCFLWPPTFADSMIDLEIINLSEMFKKKYLLNVFLQ